jgi:intergrase/recombinase
VLLNSDGGRLKVERLDADGKLCKIDNIVSAFSRLRKETKIKKQLKLIRKTSATLLKSGKNFSGVDAIFLGHSPRSVADRHYAQVPQALFDEAVKWLGVQYGVK